jgi:hypothetical protein
MDHQPAATTSRSNLLRLWPWFTLLLILCFVAFIRFRLLDMPLERDEGEYAYAGQLILQGIPPYELAYNMKLPGTYFACALGMAIFGQTIAGMHSTLIVVNSLTTVFIFLLGRKLFGIVPGLVAAASYALMSVSPAVLGMATHANQFVVLFAVPATLLLWKGCAEGHQKPFFFSGILYGLAFLMKQQGIFFGAFGGMYLIWIGIRNRNFPETLKTLFIYGSGIFLPFLCLCLLLVRDGVFSRFWFWTFTYAHSYVGIVTFKQGIIWLFEHLELDYPVAVGFWLLGLAGLLCGLCDKTLREKTIFIAASWVFAFFGTATGLYFRDHYFILVLPAFSLLIGLAVAAVPKKLPFQMPAYVGQATVLGLFLIFASWCIHFERAYFFTLPGNLVSRVIYKDFPFVESIAVSDYIRDHSSPDARIAVIGSEPQIYFYSQRHSATGYIYIYALNEPQPNAHAMQLEMIHEIEAAKPQYLVWVGFTNSWLLWPNADPTLPKWGAQYINDFYEKTGIADTAANGYTTYLWDDDAKNYQTPQGQCIAVYRRKDSMENSPRKN